MRKKSERRASLDASEAEILEAILGGAGYRALAAKYGVGLATLARWIEENPERSRACAAAREESADQCDEEAERVIAKAKNTFQLARARELAIHLRWRAKSRNPNRYGDRQQVGISGTLTLEQLVATSLKPPDESGG